MFTQSQKRIEFSIEKELDQTATSITDLIRTAAGIRIKNRLKAIAEKNAELVEYYYSKYLSGLITREQAMASIEEMIASQTIGINGYVYCINSKGQVILHPDEQIKGKNISRLDFVQKLIKIKDGYLEYDWLKTSKGDNQYSEKAPKAIYVTYYKPLDWIICVSAYKNEFSHIMDINEINNYTSVFKFAENGYAFIVDEKGNAVMHPSLQGQNLLEQSQNFSSVIQKMLNKKSGKMKTSWLSTSDMVSGEQLIIFRYLPQYKCVIAAASYVNETPTPFRTITTLITMDIVFFLLAFTGLAYLLSRSVTKPLEKFAHLLDSSKEGNYSIRLNYNAKDEVGSLARHFNAFMTSIEKDHGQLDTQSKKTITAQNTLKANESKLQVFFNQSFQLTSILSPHGIIEDINESQLEFSQCTQTDVLYKPYWDGPWCRYDEKNRQKIKLAVESAALGEAIRLSTTFVDAQDQIKEIDLSLKPVCRNKQVEFIVAESKDITQITLAEKEQRKLRIQLQKAQKIEAIGSLTGGIAHDFNNILSSIFGYAQLALLSLDSPEKLKNHMNQIIKGGHRATELVRQILTFSRQVENEKSPFRLHLVVKEALKLLRSSIPTTIEMVIRVETRDMVNADPSQMHQMIINLCTNAYHAMMTSGGTLTVNLTTVNQIAQEHQNKDYFRPGPFLKLVVEDTGQSMNPNPKVIKKTFDPYFTTKEIGQAGLELAMVRAIVEDHNGLFHIERIAKKGTSFFVYLPVVTKKSSSAKNLSGIDAALKPGKKTIMVVDDEPAILALIEELLIKLGYWVHTYNDGKSALDAYQTGKINFDMVITDMTMPHMTGIALAEAILSDNKNIPIILSSGYNKTINSSEIKAIGFQAFLEKPLDTYQLLNTMKMVFDK